MTMLTIVPVLPVDRACEYSPGQDCWTATVWWGDVLMCFYTKDKERLEPGRLNDEACRILQEITKAITSIADEVIAASELSKKLGGDKRLVCFWEDFEPPLSMSAPHKCVIPLREAVS